MADVALVEGTGGSRLLPDGHNVAIEAQRGRGRGRGRGSSSSRGRKRGRGTGPSQSDSGLNTSQTASSSGHRNENGGTAAGVTESSTSNRGRGTSRRTGRGGKRLGGTTTPSKETPSPSSEVDAMTTNEHTSAGRRHKFTSKLSQPEASSSSQVHNKELNAASGGTKTKHVPVEYNDMRSRLVAELSSGEYDCVVCYSCVTTKSPIWSCSQCYSVLHLSCVQKWAKSSVAKIEEQNARQEDPNIRNRKGTWRCPGCQFAREEIPRSYVCWDGQLKDPVGGKGAPPHSCGKPCSKGKCVHGCAAGPCHPGPCPPCPISITRGCFCGSQQITLRCSQLRQSNPQSSSPSSASSSVSCGTRCGKMLNCGNHHCSKICHDGACGGCEEIVQARCYCGRHTKAMKCGTGEARQSLGIRDMSQEKEWEGRWSCESACLTPFDCGKHLCKRPCHASETVAMCPFSPALINTCPCGAEAINENRRSCEDEIKTCARTCQRRLSCGHSCESKCHLGDCSPCTVSVSTPCRCGETKKQLECHQRQKEELEGGQEVLCQTICRSVRLCGKHECRRRCCPLYFQAKSKSKRKPTYEELVEQDPAGLHTCDLSCGKLLRCGLHQCEANCHRGQCPPCLQASFDELSCHCGRTVMDPPVPCGTVIRCHFPCTRPPPPCGHPKQQHDCHESEDCPPCIYLVEKQCVCGKNTVANVPCHRARVSCGQTCDAVLNCGFHRCQRSCHDAGDCGACHQTCTKPRKCGHACPEPCHAPTACPETTACQAWVTLLCACGHQRQQVRCGHSIHSPQNNDRMLKCNDSCLVAQRNAKLAEALGLNPSKKSQASEYQASTMTFFGNNRRFAEEIENMLIEFIKSYKHAMMIAPPTPSQRAFIHELVAVFGLQSEDVDEEPKKSVAVRRGMHAKVPNPLLNEAYVYFKNNLARTRLTALNPMKRQDSASNPTSSPVNMNALLLRGVFGVEDSMLSSTLRRLTGGAPIQLKWVNDEDVLAIVSNSNTLKLRSYSQEIRNMGNVNGGYSRLAKEVVVCYCDENGKVLKNDSISSTAMSRTSSASNIGTTSRATTGAWAAVAANSPAPSPLPARTSAWGSNAPAAAITTTFHPPSNAPSARASPRLPFASVPDRWDS